MFMLIVAWVAFVFATLVLVIGLFNHFADYEVNQRRKALGLSYSKFCWKRFLVTLSIWIVAGWWIFDR